MINYIKNNYKYLLFSFFFISIFSWILELLYSLIFRDKLVSPGVLFGPWCPIYGVTAILLMLLINKDDKKIHNIFKIFIIAIVVEYLSSFLSEKMFNRIIWDYSDFPFNINGRVCLQMSILFSMLGYIVIYYFEPYLYKLYKKLGKETDLMNLEFLFLFIIDIILKVLSKK